MTVAPMTFVQSAAIIILGLVCLGGVGWFICKIVEWIIQVED